MDPLRANANEDTRESLMEKAAGKLGEGGFGPTASEVSCSGMEDHSWGSNAFFVKAFSDLGLRFGIGKEPRTEVFAADAEGLEEYEEGL